MAEEKSLDAIKTLGDIPRFHAKHTPNAIALILGKRRQDYLELDRLTNRIANGLDGLGVSAQERVAYLGRNSDRFFHLLLGAAKADVVTVPLNWRLAPPELKAIVDDAAPKMLFVEPDFVSLIDGFRDKLPARTAFVVLGDEKPGWTAFDRWTETQSDRDEMRPVEPESTVLQIYTSGTTGLPKGACLPHRAFDAPHRFCRTHPDQVRDVDWLAWREDDVSLLSMPVFHVAGAGWGLWGLYFGATTVILPQYDIDDLVEAFASHPITRLNLVPTAIHQLLHHPRIDEIDFASLRTLVYGASPIPLDLLKETVGRIGNKLVQMYGMTEAAGGVTFLSPADHSDPASPRLRSAGRAMPGGKITIRDSDGRSLPVGETGEICVEALTLMSGYWNRPDETKAAMGDMYLRSGDAGHLDADGYVFVKDRVKDMIITGGENVYPAEVENAIYGHPAVDEVSVIGVPDPRWGETVKAVIVLKAGAAADTDAILDFTRARIGGYKVPKSVDFVESLPKNATGKVLKRDLREQYRQLAS